ncbi:Alkylated DNA repair protein alkB 8 [Globomyces sp. JEL0801]|nr:Alkylated DNA repair protein alkB 8 [Globomyces sp. JEL0801]
MSMIKKFQDKPKKRQIQLEILSRLENHSIEELISQQPTKVLIALNASYDSLITGSQLHSTFNIFPGFIKIEMFLGSKPYSYIFFKSDDDANNAFQHLNGFKSEVLNKVLLLEFANWIPTFPSRVLINKEINQNIDGLTYIPDFISQSEEEELVRILKVEGDNGRWECLQKRLVQHYGYKFKYGVNDVDRDGIDVDDNGIKMPEWTDHILNRLINQTTTSKPNQLTVNYYVTGNGIPFHNDSHFAFISPIVVVSLSGDIVMDFRYPNGQVKSCLLQARSLLIMDGYARYTIEHGIKPRKMDLIDGLVVERSERWSLTFRTIRDIGIPCPCNLDNCNK